MAVDILDLGGGDVDAIRAECADIVSHPGKFEGESIYAPYFNERTMVGDGEHEDLRCAGCAERSGGDESECENCESMPGDSCLHLDIDDTERAAFPELEDATRATVYEDSQGFVYVTLS